ncbi:hypothetical protein GGR56DRAFT_652283 [Xylariaceae sp. FL0804]|nr:hypothetical protein GGR56DRAFT_652283 [Xylariaceae sp. FL0804]
MKSVSVAAALLASVAMAQPRGHRHLHAKRAEEIVTDMVTETAWDITYETVTVVVDPSSTETLLPAEATSSTVVSSSALTSSSAAVVSAAEVAPAPTSSSSTSSSSSTTTLATTTVQTHAAAPVVTTPTTTETPVVTTPTTTATPVTTAAETPVTTAVAAAAVTAQAASEGSSAGSAVVDGIREGVANMHQGSITYYAVGLGACGWDDAGQDESSNIVAIPHAYWDSISTATNLGVGQPANPLCGKHITIEYQGKTSTAEIRDRCGGCDGMHIDVSQKVFTDLFGSTESGIDEISWYIQI